MFPGAWKKIRLHRVMTFSGDQFRAMPPTGRGLKARDIHFIHRLIAQGAGAPQEDTIPSPRSQSPQSR